MTIVESLLLLAVLLTLTLGLLALREARAVLRSTVALVDSLHKETIILVREASYILAGTKDDLARIEDLIEENEYRGSAVNAASRIAVGAVSAPLIRARAFQLGVRRARELFRVKRRK